MRGVFAWVAQAPTDRRGLFCAGFFFALCLVGCGGRGDRTLDYAPTVQESGRVRWTQPSGDRLVADVHFTRDEGHSAALLVGKEVTMLRLLRQGDQVRADGRFTRGGWRGSLADAPRPLSDWVALLQAWEAAGRLSDGRQELHTGTHRVSFEHEGGRLVGFHVVVNASGSEFTVQMARRGGR